MRDLWSFPQIPFSALSDQFSVSATIRQLAQSTE
jgi:hypothetical protein